MNVEIADSLAAKSSARCAMQAIREYLHEFTADSATTAMLPLRVELGDLIVEHIVTASADSTSDPSQRDTLRIQWIPENARIYPSFLGTVRTEDTGIGICQIQIAGAYSPPFGPPGVLIDVVLGRRVAHATLSELLGRFRFRAEAAYRARAALSPE